MIWQLHYITGGIFVFFFTLCIVIIIWADVRAYRKYGFKPTWGKLVYFFSKESEDHEDLAQFHKWYIRSLFAWVFFGMIFIFAYFIIEALKMRDSGF